MSADYQVQPVILAAGKSTRMGAHQKVLQNILGRPVLTYVFEAAAGCSDRAPAVVVGHRKEEVQQAFEDRTIQWIHQSPQRGTGHALMTVRSQLDQQAHDVLVLLGDCPGITADTLENVKQVHREETAALTLLTADLDDPQGYGRVLRSEEGEILRIVEEDEATSQQQQIREVNSGVMLLDTEICFPLLDELPVHEQSEEIYLTDLVALLQERNETIRSFTVDSEEEILGMNTPRQKSEVSEILRNRIIFRHMKNGVEIRSPEQTYIEPGAELGPGTVVEPFVVIRSEVEIGSNCHVGPFCQIRPGTVLEDGAEIGNFVETKKARLGEESKAKHLAYIGDARIGKNVNIGAGTITANYDGERKHQTRIKDGSSTGSNSVLVAPVQLGENSQIGAGAVVVEDVNDQDTVVGVPAKSVKDED